MPGQACALWFSHAVPPCCFEQLGGIVFFFDPEHFTMFHLPSVPWMGTPECNVEGEWGFQSCCCKKAHSSNMKMTLWPAVREWGWWLMVSALRVIDLHWYIDILPKYLWPSLKDFCKTISEGQVYHGVTRDLKLGFINTLRGGINILFWNVCTVLLRMATSSPMLLFWRFPFFYQQHPYSLRRAHRYDLWIFLCNFKSFLSP